MPTVNVKRALLFQLMGRSMSDKEFDDLCFQYGIELDSVVDNNADAAAAAALAALTIAAPAAAKPAKAAKAAAAPAAAASSSSAPAAAAPAAAAPVAEDVTYKIEIPANRYDLLCVEGIARALRVFLQIDAAAPRFQVVVPAPGKIVRIVQKKETLAIRPFVVGAILRDVTFTPDSFASFIDLQDKLHQNIGRKRTLVAIGTHDLDTIAAPFTYEALPKRDIKFVPLSEEKEFDAAELFAYYNGKANHHLKPYLYITENSPVQPVIYDAKRIVCSMPPIINGEHSKITLQTKNVFIECTGTDLTKLNVTLNQVLTMFSQYCAAPYTIEAVEVHNESTGVTKVYPNLDPVPFVANVAYVNSAIGIDVTPEAMTGFLKKMSMESTLDAKKENITVLVPPTRSDVLHACDLMEDIAISYGFNKVPRTLPQCYTTGKYNKLNSVSDAIREQVAQAGFNEVLTWVLLSFDDNYRFMQPKDVQGITLDIKSAQAVVAAGSSVSSQLLDKPLIVHPLLAIPKAITLANPKSLDFQLVRTTLLPGLLKALSNNQGQVNLPIKLFECGDIGFQSEETDVGAKNQRRIGALYCDVRSGFEVIQGLLDRVMAINGVYFAPSVAEYRAQKAKQDAKKEAARKAQEAADKKKASAAAKSKAAPTAAKGATAAPLETAAPAAAEAPSEDAEWKVVDTFSLRPSQHPSYFPGRRADIILHRLAQQDEIVLGTFGILHPDVISQFGIPYVCSAMEINLEYFM